VFFFFLGTLKVALVIVVEVGRQGNQKEKGGSVKAVFFFLQSINCLFFRTFKRSLMSYLFLYY